MAEMSAHVLARAAHARVSARKDLPERQRKRYGALAHKLPGLILQNGLAQATGFLLAKNEEEHQRVLADLHGVLHAARVTNTLDGKQLHAEIIAADLDQTLVLTRHALDAGGWLKRYVQGVLRVDATGESLAPDADD